MRTAVHYKDDITWWAVTPDGYGGFTYAAPIVVAGRWEERADQYQTPGGRQVVSRAVVYLDRVVSVQDYLFKGISSAANPTTVSGTFQVEQFQEVPDLRNLDSIKKAYL